MSSRGISIRVNRLEAIRVLGECMRNKQEDFKLAKLQWPAEFRRQRELAAGAYSRKAAALRVAKTHAEFNKLLGEGTLDYRKRNDWPSPPELNLCREKQLLLMLQHDVREVVPINSNHDLWAVLQGKCEPIS